MLGKGRLLFAALALSLLSGCASIVAPPYSPDYESIDHLKKMSLEKMSVGTVQPQDPKAPVNHIGLRAASLVSPDGTFAAYLEKALRSDLTEMGFFDPASTTKLDATILKNDIDISGLSKGSGTMQVKLTVTKNGAVAFEKDYSATTEFESSFAGAVAIPKGQSEYPNLVRALLKQIYSDAAFIEAVKK
jgi:hypothetical protein